MISAYSDQFPTTPATRYQQTADEPAEITSADVVDCVKLYARRHPEKMALLCFGVGFVLGWKLKPW